MYKILFTSIVLLFLFGCDSSTSKKQPKVLLIGVDGFTNKLIEEANMTYLSKLMNEGSVNRDAMLTKDSPTVSGAGWATIITGVYPSKHGITGNDDNNMKSLNRKKYPDLFTYIHSKDASLETYVAYDWHKLKYLFPQSAITKYKAYKEDSPNLVDSYEKNDKFILKDALVHLSEDKADFTFVYFGALDEIGHEYGRGNRYVNEMKKLDKYIEKLVVTIKQRKTYASEDWMVMFVTDHGHKPEGGHGGFSYDERNTMFLVWNNNNRVTTPKNNGDNADYFATIVYFLFGEEVKGKDGNVTGIQ